MGIEEQREITVEEGYKVMVKFVELYSTLILSEEIKELFETVKFVDDIIDTQSNAWLEWMDSVKLIKS